MNNDPSYSTLQWVPHVPVPVNLRRLFPRASFVGCGDIHTAAATDCSGECQPHSLFAVIRGARAVFCHEAEESPPLFIHFTQYPPNDDATMAPDQVRRHPQDDLCLDVLL